MTKAQLQDYVNSLSDGTYSFTATLLPSSTQPIVNASFDFN
jgi:hypothetical protein